MNLSDFIERCEREAKARQREAGRKHGKGKPKKDSLPPNGDKLKREPTTTQKVAAATGTKPRNLERAKAVKENAPDLFEQMETRAGIASRRP